MYRRDFSIDDDSVDVLWRSTTQRRDSCPLTSRTTEALDDLTKSFGDSFKESNAEETHSRNAARQHYTATDKIDASLQLQTLNLNTLIRSVEELVKNASKPANFVVLGFVVSAVLFFAYTLLFQQILWSSQTHYANQTFTEKKERVILRERNDGLRESMMHKEYEEARQSRTQLEDCRKELAKTIRELANLNSRHMSDGLEITGLEKEVKLLKEENVKLKEEFRSEKARQEEEKSLLQKDVEHLGSRLSNVVWGALVALALIVGAIVGTFGGRNQKGY